MRRSHGPGTRRRLIAAFAAGFALMTWASAASGVDDAAEYARTVIDAAAVTDAVESSFTAAAVNGLPIPPTDRPEAEIGDVITFRVDIRSRHDAPLHDLRFGVEWGPGFAYQDRVEGENVICRPDGRNRNIDATVPLLSPDGADPVFFAFDLKLTDCAGLFIHVRSDELHACEAVKTYYIAVRLTRPDPLCAPPSFFDPPTPPAPDLAVTATPEACRLLPDAPTGWTVYVTNNGNAPARDAAVRLVLGGGLGPAASAGREESGRPPPEIRENDPEPGWTTLIWRIDEIPPGAVTAFRVMARPDAAAAALPEAAVSDVIVTADCGETDCRRERRSTPFFYGPDECISADVYEGPGRFHGFLSLDHEYISNLYGTTEDIDDAWVTRLTPGVWIAAPASRSRPAEIVTASGAPGGLSASPFFPDMRRPFQAYLLYSPRIEIYHDHSDKNIVSHQADAYVHYATRNKFTIQAFDQFQRSHDAVSSRIYTVGDRYTTNLFAASATYDVGEKLRMRLDYGNFLLDYDAEENNVSDRTDNAVSVYGFYRFSPKTAVFGEYEQTGMDYDSNGLDSLERRFYVGVRWDVTEKSAGRIKFGYGKRTYDVGFLSDAGAWMAEAAIDHRLTAKTRITLNAYRRYDEVPGVDIDAAAPADNIQTHILTHMIGLGATYEITPRLRLDCHATLFHDAYGYEAAYQTETAREDIEWRVSPALSYTFKDRLTLALSWDHAERDSNDDAYDRTEDRLMFRAAVHW